MAQFEPIELAQFRDPDSAVYDGVGVELRKVREQADRPLADVADALRIRVPHLEAIEDGRFEELPARVYAIGFLRAYAGFLGLDPEAVVARFRQETADTATGVELNFPEPPPQSWRPNIGVFGVALALAVAAYGGWYMLQRSDDVQLDLIAEVPERLIVPEDTTEAPPVTVADMPAAPEGAPSPEDSAAGMEEVAVAPADEIAPDPVAAAEEVAEADAPAAAVEPTAAPPEVRRPGAAQGNVVRVAPEAAGESEPAVEVDLAAVDAEPAPAPEPDLAPASEPLVGAEAGGAEAPTGAATTITGALAATPEAPTLIEEPPAPPVAPAVGEYEPRVFGQGNENARVVLRARADSWIQVQGADNDLILTRILHPGDVFLVPDRPGLSLVTGNAGGLEVLVDGVLMPPLGSDGAVRRNIPLDPEALTAGEMFEQP